MYKRSVIPCCKTCNNKHLSRLETVIKNGVERGFYYFKENVPVLRIYQWCQLVFYKWLYKETFLRGDIKDPMSERIVPRYNFESMAMNHLMLRSMAGSFFYNNAGNWKDRPFEDNGIKN
jgi:hypothetical protein